MSRIRTAGAVAALALTAAVTACSAPAAQDPQAHAQLDPDNERVATPLSEFSITQADMRTINQARDTVLDKCMTAHGFTGSASVKRDSVGDRPFGLWVVPLAAKEGYGASHPDTGVDENDPKWQQARAACVEENRAALDEVTPASLKSRTPSVASNLQVEAREKAKSDAQWNAARKDWIACLKAKGLSVDSNSPETWSSAQGEAVTQERARHPDDAEAKEREINIAVTEATCNNDQHLTQRLGDLVASYEAPLIAKNRSALEAEKTSIATALDHAKSVIARG